MVFFFVFLLMLYVATGKKFYLVIGLGLVAIGGVGAYFAFDHVQTRVATWLNPSPTRRTPAISSCRPSTLLPTATCSARTIPGSAAARSWLTAASLPL